MSKNARESMVVFICEQSVWLASVGVLYDGFYTEEGKLKTSFTTISVECHWNVAKF